jgi:multidrug efflux pump
VRKPQGALEDSSHRWQVQTNDELKTAAEYQPLIVHYNNGAAVRLRRRQRHRLGAGRAQRRDDQRQTGDFADDPQAAGSQYHPDGGQHSRPPAGAAETIPAAIDLQIAQDRSPTIRASLERWSRRW